MVNAELVALRVISLVFKETMLISAWPVTRSAKAAMEVRSMTALVVRKLIISWTECVYRSVLRVCSRILRRTGVKNVQLAVQVVPPSLNVQPVMQLIPFQAHSNATLLFLWTAT